MWCELKYTNLGHRFRICSQDVLLGTITPNIRQIWIGLIDKTIQFIVIFDGEISEDDEDNMSCVGTELLASIGGDFHINEQFISISPPNRYERPNEDYFCVYARKE
ncbi:MAG: hypothetical protein IJR46_06230 [Neisseriaceae bacterium]|nr:hypothetical protein [Neisseriaceae bacterium]